MEIHHHPDLHRKNKPWKEYFLEFLMIFLAVTLGFFAESFREHLAEKAREKEYMKEIVENLKYDTIRCTLNSTRNIELMKGMDSLRAELKNAAKGNIRGNMLYYFTLLYGAHLNEARFNTSAITELKNSGSLRLIENKKLVALLADYYERKIHATESYDPNPEATELQKKEGGFYSLIELDDYISSFKDIQRGSYSTNFDYKQILEKEPTLKLLKTDPKSLEDLYNDETKFEISLRTYNFWLDYCKEAASGLITEIQKEYHLENE